jgi:ABC-type amino acid transport substrate-binding protein
MLWKVLPMLSRRLVLAASGGLALPRLARASGAPLTIVYGAFPPYTIADPARPGIVNEIAGEVVRMVGRRPVFEAMEWPDAQARVRGSGNTLLTPPGRNPSREPHYTWIVKVLDLEASIGTLAPNGPLDLEAGRRVARMGVVAQSTHEAYLRAQGYTNLVTVPLARVMEALLAGEVDALFTQTLEMRWRAQALGRAADLRLGPQLLASGAFIAASRTAEGVPVQEMRDAFAALESEGAIERIVRSYTG